MDEPNGESPPTLAEEGQKRARLRIRDAAMDVVSRKGFGATVEEIAGEAGVSPRTVFRHYLSHDQLIVAVAKEMFEACARRPFGGVMAPEDDLYGWLEALALTIHSRNADILGAAFWDLHAPSLEASEAFAEVAELRREYRVRGVGHLVAMAWRAAGGTGAAPEDLRLAFAVNFSAFTTQALMVDFDQTPVQIAHATAHMLLTLLEGAVRESTRDLKERE